MEITRINTYDDPRFSKVVLCQHGAYLIGEEPYEVEIVSDNSAIVRGKTSKHFESLIEEFRFHAPHIYRFFDEAQKMIKEYPKEKEIWVELSKIQPSQFYVDEEKLEAVRSFIQNPEDVVIQVIPWEDRYISLDGHTRLFLAKEMEFDRVKAVLSETDDWVWKFVAEAKNRGVFTPTDMQLVSHEDYDVKWNQFCDEVFAAEVKED